jgi:ELWxxDGT repeat protein
MSALLKRLQGLLSGHFSAPHVRRQPSRRSLSKCPQALVESLEIRQLLAATLIRDFNTDTFQLGPNLTSDSYYLGKSSVVWNDSLYYFADTSLYRSDSSGVTEVINYAPGEEFGASGWLTPVGDKLYFRAMSATAQRLWVSDGTAAGTFPLRESENDLSRPEFFTEYNGKLLFVGENKATGYELWTSDGTSAGTQPLFDLIPGPDFAYIDQITVVGENFYFAANVPEFGRELWRSDGTAAGTVILKDVEFGPDSSFPRDLTVVGDRLYFSAGSIFGNRELWTSDGTTAGTVRVLDEQNNTVIDPASLTVFGNALLFRGKGDNGAELWRADGQSAFEVADLNPGSDSSNPRELVGLGNKIFFVADGFFGRHLYSSDGTTAGTQIAVYTKPYAESRPSNLAIAGNLLFFAGFHEDYGKEVWRTDGTQEGTVLLKDISPGIDSGFDPTIGMKSGSSTVYFTATDGTSGTQIWRSDGTVEGTQQITEPVTWPLSGEVGEFTDIDGTLYFVMRNTPSQLWKSDGTTAGTVLVKDIPTSPYETATSLTRLGNKLIFLGPSSTEGYALWVSDGTEAGTHVLHDINPTGSIGLTEFTEFQGSLYFAAVSPETGLGLWKTDGTETGTQMVADVDLTSIQYPPFRMYPAGNRLFFTADNGVTGPELWKTDGTAAGTSLVRDIQPGSVGAISQDYAAVLNNRLYFAADDGINGTELWTSDGTEAGTYMVLESYAGPVGLDFGAFFAVNGKLLFIAKDAAFGRELWSSDGTAAGTAPVLDIRPGADSALDTSFNAVISSDGNSLCFKANDGVHGFEPWISDGTWEGTRLLRDINPGPRPSLGNILAAAPGLFYMYANDGIQGMEVWQSDGSEEGTQLTVDVLPGIAPSFTYDVLPVGNTLFLSGYSPAGYELLSTPINKRPIETTIDSNLIYGELSNVLVGKLLVNDPDSDNTASFSLVSGPGDTDNHLFDIFRYDSSPDYYLRTTAILDYEEKDHRYVRVRATDALGQYTESILYLQVMDDNEYPTLDQPANITVAENAAPVIIPLTGISAGVGENQPLRISVKSSNASLIPQSEVSYVSPDSVGSLRLTITPQAAGESTITIEVMDGGFDNNLDTIVGNEFRFCTFVVTVVPSRPVITSPLGSTFLQQPVLKFTEIPTAESYEVWIGNRSTGQMPLLQATTVQPEYKVPVDLGIGRIDAYVRAKLPGNRFGQWSAVNRFNINTRAVVAPLSPRQATARPTVTVTPLTGAAKYEFWLTNRTTGQSPFVTATTTQPSWTHSQDLPMSSYTLWGRGIAADGTKGGWSLQRDFIVAAAPQPLTPLSSTFSRTPTFSWAAVAGATTYEVSVRSANTGLVVASANGMTGLSWTPATPLPEGPYVWQVVVDSSMAGFRSDWSARISFNVGGRPILVAPSGIVQTNRPRLIWNTVESAASYEVWVNRVHSGGTISTKIFSVAGITTNEYQPTTPLAAGEKYRYWVRAVSNGSGVSAWSLPMDFSVQLTQLLPEPLLPAHPLALLPDSFTPRLAPPATLNLSFPPKTTPSTEIALAQPHAQYSVNVDSGTIPADHDSHDAIDDSITAIVDWLQTPVAHVAAESRG